MTLETEISTKFSALVREDRIHSSVFTDPDIFEAEMVRIFSKTWIFVGHESEVEQPGDYALKWIGKEPVIMSRDEDGQVHLLLNRCRHRGVSICQQERGNSSFLRCGYHGWTYKSSGELVGVSFPRNYPEPLDPVAMGLTRVPMQESYRGFIFGRMCEDGPSLLEHLGLTAQYIDAAVDASPSGKIKLSAGAQKTVYEGNWKYIGMDGYHPNFAHSSVVALAQRKAAAAGGQVNSEDVEDGGRTLDIGDSFTGRSPNRTEDLGNGHSRLDTAINSFIRYDETITPTFDNEHGRDYIEALAKKVGAENVKQTLVDAYDPHVGVYPNLQIINTQVQVIRPISADQTEVSMYPIMLEGVDEGVNADRIEVHEWFYGAASFGTSDDSEMFERMHKGFQSKANPWIITSRGLGKEETLEDGRVVGHITDEVPQRAMMRQWLILMESGEGKE